LTVRNETADMLLSILSHLKQHMDVSLSVKDGFCSFLKEENLIQSDDEEDDDEIEYETSNGNGTIMTFCDDLSLLCFARCCVELGAMAVVDM